MVPNLDPRLIQVGGGWMGRIPVAEDPRLGAGPGRKGRAKQHGMIVYAEYPPEDPADGCPGGWYRSRFIYSILPYLRRRDGQGGRVANLMLDRTDDEVLLALVAYAEDEQERWEAYKIEVMMD